MKIRTITNFYLRLYNNSYNNSPEKFDLTTQYLQDKF